MKNFEKTFSLIFIFLAFLVSSAVSQVQVERSKDKVIISGVPYYVHTVRKGETAYSISRAYGITVETLTKENPPAVYGVKEGQVLHIPVSLAGSPAEPVKPYQPSGRDETRYVYHKLQAGETVYSLSRKYGVSENDIILSNPGIEINKLPLNSEIAIPKKEFMSEKQKFEDQNYIYHKVVRGETLSSIARSYGISLRDLRRENRDVRFPQVGSYIRIPMKGKQTPAPKPVAGLPDTLIREDTIKATPLTEEVTSFNKLQGSIDVAVLLPFYLRENARRIEVDSSRWLKGKRVYRVINRSEDWIYPRSLGFVEMYCGILLAVDTLRSLGLNVNLNVYDIGIDTTEVIRLIRSGKLEQTDLIIGPAYSKNLSIVASYAGQMGIPVVSPVQLQNNKVLKGNPLLFAAHPTLEVSQKAIAAKIANYYDHNYVFVYTNTPGTYESTAQFKNMIFDELRYRVPLENVRFKELAYLSRSVLVKDSINRLEQALSNRMKNVVIIATDDPPAMSEIIMDLFNLSRKYDMKVFGYPDMRTLDNLDPRYFFELGLMIYTPSWIDYSQNDIRNFNSDYRRIFKTEPEEMSYAWTGYEIAYYFISGIALHGRQFLEHPEIHNPDLLQTRFDFRRLSPSDGYENNHLFLIRYSRGYETQLAGDEIAPTPLN
ncbi:MAG: LysM peptidoglycan-binding domain-containing protein [Bacteroidales bacterium]|nr:LysM peptidoglycan-binding domain-containing protein [Bacteroidales bacterium]